MRSRLDRKTFNTYKVSKICSIVYAIVIQRFRIKCIIFLKAKILCAQLFFTFSLYSTIALQLFMRIYMYVYSVPILRRVVYCFLTIHTIQTTGATKRSILEMQLFRGENPPEHNVFNRVRNPVAEASRR